MRHFKKWTWLVALSSASTMLGWSCAATDFRDAAYSGVLDYVSGTTTAAIAALFGFPA
jgi:hypothetical protein